MGLIRYLTVHRKWKIKRNGIVLDLGSGSKPLFRADILVDKYLYADLERSGKKIVVDRPMFCADGQYLPFKDKSIDFIYCNQLLEHIVDPGVFLRELERVGKRGLITSINGYFEKLNPVRWHLWYLWIKDGKLLLEQKKEGMECQEFKALLLDMISRKGFWKFYSRNFDLFNVVHLWENKIEFEIIKYGEFDFSKFQKSFMEDDLTSEMKKATNKQRMRSLVGKTLRPIVSSSFDLNAILCCPKCKGDLSELNKKVETLNCKKCNETYRVRRGIPLMDVVERPMNDSHKI